MNRITFALAISVTMLANAQQLPVCTASATNLIVRAEGLAEPVGDITLDCTGSPGPAGGDLILSLPVNITNRLGANGAPDVRLTVDNGSGPVATGTAAIATNTVTFSNIAFTVPPSGRAALRISNLRAAVHQMGINYQGMIQASLSGSGFVLLNNNGLSVATAHRGLLLGLGHATITCTGSPMPAQLGFANALAAGTRFASFRIKEGFPTAFAPKAGQADTGIRILARYTGFPKIARVFLPAAVAGSSALQPTAAGDLGLTPSGGQYARTPNGSLLLVLVSNADATGAGGTLGVDVSAFGAGPIALDALTELPVAADGSVTAVYEVVDSGPAIESAQIPVFVGMGPTGGITANIDLAVTFGPLSNDATASAAAPVPRFADEEPMPDM